MPTSVKRSVRRMAHLVQDIRSQDLPASCTLRAVGFPLSRVVLSIRPGGMTLVCRDLVEVEVGGGEHVGTRVAEGGHEGGLDGGPGNFGALELEVGCGAGVVHDGDEEAEVERGPGGRVDAHAAHHAHDDEVFDVLVPE